MKKPALIFIAILIAITTYSQCLSGDCLNGFGKMKYDNGVYEGAFKDGKKHGNGTYNWVDGAKYVGDWSEDNRNGKGVLTCCDGEKYDGFWYYDKKSGYGTLTWNNGNVYKGDFMNNNIHGWGTEYNAKGELVFDGLYKIGKQFFDANVFCSNLKAFIDASITGRSNYKVVEKSGVDKIIDKKFLDQFNINKLDENRFEIAFPIVKFNEFTFKELEIHGFLLRCGVFEKTESTEFESKTSDFKYKNTEINISDSNFFELKNSSIEIKFFGRR